MSKGDQHFVPRVYLKRWSHSNNDNVYYYEKPNLSIGEPRNVESILRNRHTYTITYDDYFALDYMPKIKQDFAEQIIAVLRDYNAVAFYNDKCLGTSETFLVENLGAVEKWVFRKADNIDKLAPKRGIVANIKEIRSYIIETALDDYIEKKWNGLLDTFVRNLELGYSLRMTDEDIEINPNTIEGIISTLLLFMCRNPHFDYQMIFPSIKDTLLDIFLQSAENVEQEQEMRDFIDKHMRCAWLVEVYKALFHADTGFFIQYFNAIKENCQITIMRCLDENGSFIASDNPAFSFVSHIFIKNYNAIYFPLAPNYLLMIGKGQKNSLNKIDVRTITNNGVRHFNRIILSKANEAIVSNRKYLGYII